MPKIKKNDFSPFKKVSITISPKVSNDNLDMGTANITTTGINTMGTGVVKEGGKLYFDG